MGEEKTIEIIGSIDRVSRVNGKASAEVKIFVPLKVGADIPLGNVIITIKPVQKSMFPGKPDVEVTVSTGAKKKAVRGNRG